MQHIIFFALLIASASVSAQPLNISNILYLTNNLRAQHNAPPVVWDNNIAAFSQSWAYRLQSTRSFQHSTNTQYGENLAFVSFPSNPSYLISYAVSLWYTEANNYNYNNPGFSTITGHFTALVWASTTSIGAGVATDPTSGSSYIVMNFYPAGNVEGAFEVNVLPPALGANPRPSPSPKVPSPQPSPSPSPSPRPSPKSPNMPSPSPQFRQCRCLCD